MGNVDLSRQPGAVIDQPLEVHVLGQRHEHTAVHAGRGAVHRMIAPGLRAVEVEPDLAFAGDLHLDRNIVEPVRIGEWLKAGLTLGHMTIKGVAAINSGHRELARPGKLRSPAFLDEFLGKPLPIFQADLFDELLDVLAHVDAGGDLGLLIQHPVNRHAQIALAADHVVAANLVVFADFLGTNEQALGEAFLSKADIAAGRDAPRFEFVADGTGPADQRALVKYRHHIHDVGDLDRTDEGIVVGEDVSVADARILLVSVSDHPFDEPAHRVHMHHDAVRKCDCIAFRRVDRHHHFADFPHARGGRDAARHFARRDAIGTQFRMQRLEFQRVLPAQAKFGDAVIAAGLLHQAFGFEQPPLQGICRFVQHVCHPSAQAWL